MFHLPLFLTVCTCTLDTDRSTVLPVREKGRGENQTKQRHKRREGGSRRSEQRSVVIKVNLFVTNSSSAS